MCNDFGNRVPYSVYLEEFSELRLTLRVPDAAPNLQPRDEIWPTDPAVVFRRDGDVVTMSQLPWGLAPARPKAPVVINLRAEGRDFARNRCLVPASHYYEFTGTRSPKTRWRFTRTGEDWFCFAGFVGRGAAGEAFALLTVDAGPDVAPLHTRQPVVLDRAHWGAWLDPATPARDLLYPSPAGSLQVMQAPR
jgi:putative SOS response-associated peptidase YedK